MKTLKDRTIKGVLLDITGVLVESSAQGDGTPVPGSIEAVQALRDGGVPVRFVTNETQKTRQSLMEKLHRLGFSLLEEEMFTPALAMRNVILEKKLRPFLLVHQNCLPDLQTEKADGTGDFNAVILGDAVDAFSYTNMNKAFRVVKKTNCDIYSLGKGKFYQEDGELTLDVGPFTAALEYATDRKSLVVGKPEKSFFLSALADMGVSAEEAVMVGDDVVSDVGGAQACGLMGVLVRTGKYRPEDEQRQDVKPDLVVDNLEALVKQMN